MSTLDGYVLTPDQFENARKRAAVPQPRAMARGVTGQVSRSGQRGGDDDPGRHGQVRLVVVEAGVAGTPARYGDWQILAQLVARSGGGVAVRPAAGVKQIPEELIQSARAGGCEHCQSVRRRRCGYLIRREGEAMVVGKSCLGEVLGLRALFISVDDVIDHVGWGAAQFWPPAYTVETVAAHTYAVVAVCGWMPGFGPLSTAAKVAAALSGFDDSDVGEQVQCALGDGWAAARGISERLARTPRAMRTGLDLDNGATRHQIPVLVRALRPHLPASITDVPA